MRFRLVVLALLVLFAAPLPAQSSAVVDSARAVLARAEKDSTIKRDVATQINVVVDHLSQKLEVPAKELYRVLARQGLVEGLSYLPWALIWIVLIFVYWRVVKHAYEGADGTFLNDDARTAYSIVGWIVTAVLGLAAANCLANFVMYALNPEYYAIQTIVDAFKAVTH